MAKETDDDIKRMTASLARKKEEALGVVIARTRAVVQAADVNAKSVAFTRDTIVVMGPWSVWYTWDRHDDDAGFQAHLRGSGSTFDIDTRLVKALGVMFQSLKPVACLASALDPDKIITVEMEEDKEKESA